MPEFSFSTIWKFSKSNFLNMVLLYCGKTRQTDRSRDKRRNCEKKKRKMIFFTGFLRLSLLFRGELVRAKLSLSHTRFIRGFHVFPLTRGEATLSIRYNAAQEPRGSQDSGAAELGVPIYPMRTYIPLGRSIFARGERPALPSSELHALYESHRPKPFN